MRVLILLAAAGIAVYAALCAWAPFVRCRRCLGSGMRVGRTAVLRRPVGRPCQRCRASGKRLRWGRRAWNAWARIRAAAIR